MRIRSPRDKCLQRRRRSGASDATRRPWLRVSITVIHRTTWHAMMRQCGWPVRVMAPMAGCASAIRTACPSGIRAVRARLRYWRCGPWRGSPGGVRRPDAHASPWFGAGWVGRRAPQAPLRQSTKRLRFGCHRVAALPHHCRPQGVPRPPCLAPGRPHPRRGAGIRPVNPSGQQEPVPWTTLRSKPRAACAAR